MLLTVKLLLGQRCCLEVSGKESVAMLKKLVSKQLQIPEEQQHLLFRGQLMDDDKCLSDYCCGPCASISVIIRPPGNEVQEESHQAQPDPWPQPLWHQLGKVLAKHFEPQDATAVLQLLRQEHEQHLRRVSLEALEQLAGYLLTERLPEELAKEKEPKTLAPEDPLCPEEEEADQ